MNPDNTAQNPDPTNINQSNGQVLETPVNKGLTNLEPVSPEKSETPKPQEVSPIVETEDLPKTPESPDTKVSSQSSVPHKATITTLPPISDVKPSDPPPPVVTEKPKKEAKPFKPMFVLVPIIVVLGLLLGSAFFVVYGKASFVPFELKMAVSSVVLKLPVLPKTKEYVIASAIEKNRDLRSGRLGANISLSSSAVSELMESSSVNVDAGGTFDYIDSSNPKLNFNVKAGEFLDLDFTNLSGSSYFRINKLGLNSLSAFSDIDSLDLSPILDVWVRTREPFTTSIEEGIQERTGAWDSEEFPKDELLTFLKEDLLPEVVMTKVDDGGGAVYQLSVQITPELLQKLAVRLGSEAPEVSQVTGGMLSIYIDTRSYYVEKLALALTFEPYLPAVQLPMVEDNTGELEDVLGDSTPTEVVLDLAVNISDQGSSFDFQEPQESISMDDYIDRVTELAAQVLVAMYAEDMESFKLSSDDLTDTPDIEEEIVPEQVDITSEEEDSPFGKMLP